MKRMHDKKQLGGCYRHFIHFDYAGRTMKFEFYDNHSGRYTKADLGNLCATGKYGMMYHSVEGYGVLSIVSISANGGTYVYWNPMDEGWTSGSITYANVTNFVDEA